MATASELGAVDRGRRMFRVDLSENRLVRLKERRFADLNLRERDHLQEWLVRMPDALGEELLIVQKEFDGFADTRERLDLLALCVFRTKWNADFGRSGTSISDEVEHRFRDVEHGFRDVERRFRTKWNIGSGDRERSSVA